MAKRTKNFAIARRYTMKPPITWRSQLTHTSRKKRDYYFVYLIASLSVVYTSFGLYLGAKSTGNLPAISISFLDDADS